MPSTPKKTAILWFRQDLRLEDNVALLHALDEGYGIYPLFILDDENAGEWKLGGASRWWLHESLKALNESLGSHMIFRSGKADEILFDVLKETGASAVFWNRCYEPWRIARDKRIVEKLKSENIDYKSFKDLLLWEPWEVLKPDGTPYKVFTPYYRKGCLSKEDPAQPRSFPLSLNPSPPRVGERERRGEAPTGRGGPFVSIQNKGFLSDLNLMPKIHWYKSMAKEWTPGENGARERMRDFFQSGLKGYKVERNRPDLEYVSRLSPHLHFGEISIRELWHGALKKGAMHGAENDADHFCSELGWREFSYALLYHFPQMPRRPLQPRFDHFPWDADENHLAAWQTGRTGIPIVDAGMRQLWQTGWMHNRVRMIVASYLVKHMLIHWHEGAAWFWDCLVDADLANNSASWQWVAGCGADAAPYFRVFNPVLQGKKFDPKGAYVRRYVPELKNLPDDLIHAPWDAAKDELSAAGITLGKTYPAPVVGVEEGRDRALAAFEKLKARG